VATVREPFAIIASPVAKNASPGTAPVAAIVSPKGPPFASRNSDDCKPLHLAARAEVEAMRTQVATQITSRNAVIEELRSVLEHERTRSERLEGMLADARRPWWRRWFDQGAGR
jgi:hypothetical protein